MAFIRGWQAENSNLYVKNASGDRLCTIYSNSNIANKINKSAGSITQVEVVCH
ncbi:Uncharacterised protein [Enterobacter cancerogenus]|uniref:Uncharacterized protein n=1 Tax=Enterobacter cancerogenus TaxID=69218 RepID=A0A484XLD9_9ENTR|nr:Uncharacterised protein [Enterobacter cancerogenus]